MARIGHSSPRAALIYQHATEERDRAIGDYLDTQIASVDRPERAAIARLGGTGTTGRAGCARDGGARSKRVNAARTRPVQDRYSEAAGGIEPPYGALQAPA